MTCVVITLTLGAKNREKENNLKNRIENRKKMRKELSPLLATLTLVTYFESGAEDLEYGRPLKGSKIYHC